MKLRATPRVPTGNPWHKCPRCPVCFWELVLARDGNQLWGQWAGLEQKPGVGQYAWFVLAALVPHTGIGGLRDHVQRVAAPAYVIFTGDVSNWSFNSQALWLLRAVVRYSKDRSPPSKLSESVPSGSGATSAAAVQSLRTSWAFDVPCALECDGSPCPLHVYREGLRTALLYCIDATARVVFARPLGVFAPPCRGGGSVFRPLEQEQRPDGLLVFTLTREYLAAGAEGCADVEGARGAGVDRGVTLQERCARFRPELLKRVPGALRAVAQSPAKGSGDAKRKEQLHLDTCLHAFVQSATQLTALLGVETLGGASAVTAFETWRGGEWGRAYSCACGEAGVGLGAFDPALRDEWLPFGWRRLFLDNCQRLMEHKDRAHQQVDSRLDFAIGHLPDEGPGSVEYTSASVSKEGAKSEADKLRNGRWLFLSALYNDKAEQDGTFQFEDRSEQDDSFQFENAAREAEWDPISRTLAALIVPAWVQFAGKLAVANVSLDNQIGARNRKRLIALTTDRLSPLYTLGFAPKPEPVDGASPPTFRLVVGYYAFPSKQGSAKQRRTARSDDKQFMSELLRPTYESASEAATSCPLFKRCVEYALSLACVRGGGGDAGEGDDVSGAFVGHVNRSAFAGSRPVRTVRFDHLQAELKATLMRGKVLDTGEGVALNLEQGRAVKLVLEQQHKRAMGHKVSPLRVLIVGPPGTGKTVVIKAIARHLKAIGAPDPILTAWAGKAASNINGRTLASMASPMITMETMNARWQKTQLLVIDEVWSVSLEDLGSHLDHIYKANPDLDIILCAASPPPLPPPLAPAPRAAVRC